MSRATRKGYDGEVGALELCQLLVPKAYRPRTTAHPDTDTGDIHGLPLVVSVKNHSQMRLADWVDELDVMVTRSPWETGIVIHKRARRGHSRDWYVTTNGAMIVPLIAAYLAVVGGSDHPNAGITSQVHDR